VALEGPRITVRWCGGFLSRLGRHPLRFHSAYDGEALLGCRGRLNAYADNIRVSQGGLFSIPIVDAEGNGSIIGAKNMIYLSWAANKIVYAAKISSVFGDPLRFPPRAPRVQEKKFRYYHGSGLNPMRRLSFSGGAVS